MISPSRQQRQRPPARGAALNDLHMAAYRGSSQRTTALLSRGLIDIDQGNPQGITPLMGAAAAGHSHVAEILLNSGADVSLATDHGRTALHCSAQNGHLAVTVQLIQAGADVNTKGSGVAPLHLAAQEGHSKVIAALIEAGADVDCRSEVGETPLYMAALKGHLDAVKELLRANANPLLGKTNSVGRVSAVPLDVAAHNGHSKVVRELIQQVGIEGCGGRSGGVDALMMPSHLGNVEMMAALMDGGVIDTGLALHTAAGCGKEAAVKCLIQQRQRHRAATDGGVGYVNCLDPSGATVLFSSITVTTDKGGVPYLVSPKVVRLLIDAGADTSSAVRVTNATGVVVFHGTPLAFTNKCLREKRVGPTKDEREEQMHRLEAVRRLLLRVEAAHAVSWLWPREPLLVGCAPEVSSRRAASQTPASGTQLTLMLPTLRHRRRGVLLAPLFRYSSYP